MANGNGFDLSNLQEMKKWADFGKAVFEAAKSAGLVPKRPVVKVRTIEKLKIVTRRPRRTKAEMAAARGEAVATTEATSAPETKGTLDALAEAKS